MMSVLCTLGMRVMHVRNACYARYGVLFVKSVVHVMSFMQVVSVMHIMDVLQIPWRTLLKIG